MIELAHSAGRPVDAAVATCFGCPYEGDIDPARVAAYARRLVDLGADTVYFGDTTGMGSPRRVSLLLDAVEAEGIDLGVVALHLHDTRGTGLANAYAALERGVTRFDASIGGLGGCPFAPGASGNVCTEDLVHCLHATGIETGIDLDRLVAVARRVEAIVGRTLPGQVMKAGTWDRRYPVPDAVAARLGRPARPS